MLRFFYFFLGIVFLPLILLALVLRSRKQPAFRQRLGERLGWAKRPAKKQSIIVHGASVGEIRTLHPFITALLHQPLPLTVTTFTPTGSDQVQQLFSSEIKEKTLSHNYLPLDILPCMWLFLRRVRPRAVILMETEIWPAFIALCHYYEIPVIIINGRISPRSFPRYQKIASLIRPTLNTLTTVLTQSNDDAKRFEQLGVRREKLHVSGNIKYDIKIPEKTHQESHTILRALTKQTPPPPTVENTAAKEINNHSRPIWVIGSCHEDEEELLLASIKSVLAKQPNSLIVVVPRHKERFSVWQQHLQQAGIHFIQRSQSQMIPNTNTAVWLIDTLGELCMFYGIATVVTVAGSFGRTGGHNPLEPACFAKAIITGKNTANFDDISQVFAQRNASIVVENDANHLANTVIELFLNTEKNMMLGQHAQQLVQDNQGATEKSVRHILEFIRE